MSQQHVTFKTRLFENKEPKPHLINDRCFGEDLAAWLLQRLGDAPFSFSEAIQEDYGWGFWATADKEQYWVAIGVMDEAIGSEIAEWGLTIGADPGLNLWRRLFHKPRPERLLTLCRAIDTALQNEPGITGIQWWSNEPFSGSASSHPELQTR